MFGLGFWEILVIALVVIVFVPPRKLPDFFYRLGSLYGELRAINRNVRRTMRSIERDVNNAESSERSPNDKTGDVVPASSENDRPANDRTHADAVEHAESAKEPDAAEEPGPGEHHGQMERRSSADRR